MCCGKQSVDKSNPEEILQFLDRVTPHYRVIFERLPYAQRRVLAVLCRVQRGTRVRDLAVEARMGARIVSTALTRLSAKGHVKRVSRGIWAPTDKHISAWFKMRQGLVTDPLELYDN